MGMNSFHLKMNWIKESELLIIWIEYKLKVWIEFKWNWIKNWIEIETNENECITSIVS